MSIMLDSLIEQWRKAKDAEAAAVEERRRIEDTIAVIIGIPEDLDGTVKISGILKITGRIDRKVDGDKLQQLALDAGLTDHLSALFRWKPEINRKAWDAASESITRPLLGAITSKPGRPSFAITDKKEG
jgi:hypothetical protein